MRRLFATQAQSLGSRSLNTFLIFRKSGRHIGVWNLDLELMKWAKRIECFVLPDTRVKGLDLRRRIDSRFHFSLRGSHGCASADKSSNNAVEISECQGGSGLAGPSARRYTSGFHRTEAVSPRAASDAPFRKSLIPRDRSSARTHAERISMPSVS